MICMFLISTVFTEEGSMIAAILHSKNFWVIFTQNLEVVQSLSYHIFNNIVNLEWHRRVIIDLIVGLRMTTRAIKFTLFHDTLLTVLLVLDHLGSDTMSASCLTTANHHNRLSCSKIESVLAVEASIFIRHLSILYITVSNHYF